MSQNRPNSTNLDDSGGRKCRKQGGGGVVPSKTDVNYEPHIERVSWIMDSHLGVMYSVLASQMPVTRLRRSETPSCERSKQGGVACVSIYQSRRD